MQIIQTFEKFSANQEHILREIDLLWTEIHGVDPEVMDYDPKKGGFTICTRCMHPDHHKIPHTCGKTDIILDF